MLYVRELKVYLSLQFIVEKRLTILHIDQLFKNLKVKTQIHSRPVESELKISVPVLLCCLDSVMAILSSNSWGSQIKDIVNMQVLISPFLLVFFWAVTQFLKDHLLKIYFLESEELGTVTVRAGSFVLSPAHLWASLYIVWSHLCFQFIKKILIVILQFKE